MSISAIGDSSMSQSMQGVMQGNRGQRKSPEEMASFLMEKDDADGDGLLSIGETPLDEDRFNSIDADGDGFLSEEELSSDMQKKHEEMGEMMGKLSMRMQMDPDMAASSFIEDSDADGDGMLNLGETLFDEDKFNSIDTDGDGQLSAEELSADMQAHMEQAQGGQAQGSSGAMPPPPPSEAGATAGASGSQSASSESSEEYDQYDLNEDGQVTIDELLQAAQAGDTSLSSLLKGVSGGDASAMTVQMAMQAYEAQAV